MENILPVVDIVVPSRPDLLGGATRAIAEIVECSITDILRRTGSSIAKIVELLVTDPLCCSAQVRFIGVMKRGVPNVLRRA